MKYYGSPRWSGEILDCSMPMTFDTYSKCSYNCLYCFSYYQKCHSLAGSNYQSHENPVTWVNIEKIKKLFSAQGREVNSQFRDYIDKKIFMQWGGLADQFDENERKFGKTLELLRFFKEINYPLCFSTKAVWWLDDKRYTDLFKGQKNWNVKVSIINLDKRRSSLIECGVPPPAERIEALCKITKLNCGGATLRLRPFMIGLSDVNDEYLSLIEQSAKAGATAVSTEFFCLEQRAADDVKKRYKRMSGVLGYDIYNYYKNNSTSVGYYRLSRKIKRPYVEKMKAACDKLGLRFYVSDAHFKEYCENGSCCGLASDCNYSRGQFTEAILIARKNGEVKFSDIDKYLGMYKKFLWCSATGYNIGNVKVRTMRSKQTMYEYIKECWNNPKSYKSPYRYFGGVLVPDRIDSEGNIVYKYVGDKI